MQNVNDWIEDLKIGDAVAQLAAAEGLAGLGEAAQPAIVELIQRCGDEEEAISNWCGSALEDVGRPSLEQVDELLPLASAANENVAYWAITLLGRLEGDAIRAMPVLIERLNDDSAPALGRWVNWAARQQQRLCAKPQAERTGRWRHKFKVPSSKSQRPSLVTVHRAQ